MSDVKSVEIKEPGEPEAEFDKKAKAFDDARKGEGGSVEEDDFELDPKFGSVKELQDAYHELQRKQGEKSKEPDPDKGKLELKAKEAEPAKWDAEKYTQEVLTKGELSAESKEELKGRGIPEDVIDTYLKGLEAMRDQAEATLIKEAGGEDAWREIQSWAETNLDAAEIEAVNAEIKSGDANRAMLTIRGLRARYESSAAGQTGVEGTDVRSRTSPFQSQQEMLAAMGDPRYGKDPAYTKDVDERLRHAQGLLG